MRGKYIPGMGWVATDGYLNGLYVRGLYVGQTYNPRRYLTGFSMTYLLSLGAGYDKTAPALMIELDGSDPLKVVVPFADMKNGEQTLSINEGLPVLVTEISIFLACYAHPRLALFSGSVRLLGCDLDGKGELPDDEFDE